MSRPARTYALTATATATALALLLAGCSSSGDSDQHKSSAAPVSPSVTKAAPTVQQNPLPSKVANKPALRTNVVISACTKTVTGWQAAGTARNPSTADRTYEITIFFATSQGTDQDFAVTKVPVAAGKSTKWSASKKFTAAADTRCLLRGVG